MSDTNDDILTMRIRAQVQVAKYHDGRTPADGDPDEIVEIDDWLDLTHEQVAALQQAGHDPQEDSESWP